MGMQACKRIQILDCEQWVPELGAIAIQVDSVKKIICTYGKFCVSVAWLDTISRTEYLSLVVQFTAF